MLIDLTVWDVAALIAKLFAYGGSFLAAGSVLFLLANAKLAAPMRGATLMLMSISALVGIIASLLQFGIQCGSLMDEGMSGMMDPDMMELVSGAPLGKSVALRILGLSALCLFWSPWTLGQVIAGLGAVIAAASFSFVGHGTGDPRWLLGTLVSIHLVAIAFWIGALAPLHKISEHNGHIAQAGALAHRFGKQAAFIVSALIAVGAFLAWWIIGSFETLFTTQYGITFIVKIAAVAALLGLAAANKLRFVPAMLNGEFSAARHLRTSIRFEAIIIAAVLVVTAVLTTVTPLPMGSMTGKENVESSNMEGMNHR